MNRLPGILKLIFVVLILVVVGEIGYYLYFQFTQQKNLTSQPSVIQTADISNLLPTINSTAANTANLGLNEASLRNLWGIRKDVLNSATANLVFIGEITDLELKSGITNYGFPYRVKLILKEGENSDTFYFSDASLKVLSVTSKDNQPLQFEDLIKKDRIRIEETIDLTKELSHNFIKFTITKL